MGHHHGHHDVRHISKHVLVCLALLPLVAVTLQVTINQDAVSVLGDAFHTAFDAMAYAIAVLAIVLGRLVQNKEAELHHFTNLICAALLPVAGVYIAWEAIETLNALAVGETPKLQLVSAMTAAAVGLTANLLMRWLLKKEIRKGDSQQAKTLEIVYLHVKSDIYHSYIVLFGLTAILFLGWKWVWLDPVMSFWLSMKLIKWGKEQWMELNQGRTYRIGEMTISFQPRPHKH